MEWVASVMQRDAADHQRGCYFENKNGGCIAETLTFVSVVKLQEVSTRILIKPDSAAPEC
jgi:hypothetical protein